jgi:hypothetical protein
MTRSAVAVFAAIVAGGCGGGEQHQRQTFSAADAKRIANVRPAMPGWVWPKSPEKRDSSDSSDGSESTDPLLVNLKRQTADVVDIAEAGNKWRDDNKLANLSVEVSASSADARKAMAALNVFSRGWGERSGRVTKDEQIDSLGDEAWRLWTLGQGYEVTYHWRRGNLVLEAHVDCFGVCPGDLDSVDAATRAWVDAIDEAARSATGSSRVE